MPKKLTYEFIKERFEKEGYILLSKEYSNARTKLDYTCFLGHTHSITWDKWRQGHRCPECGIIKRSKSQALSYAFVKNSFEKEGYLLLSKDYKNSSTKLKYKCPNGHEHTITWGNWQQGQRCPYCVGKAKPSIRIIKKSFSDESYDLLSDTYTNYDSKLRYRCPYGHVHCISWHNWLKGRRCPTCAAINRSGSGNPNWRGGKSLEPYCEVWTDQEYKQDIRERDDNNCLNPCCSSKNPNDLTIHHIDYDKQNCHPKNLITVCRSCNSRANTDRKWHKAWYQAIIKNRYKEAIYV